MQVQQVMTRNVHACLPSDTLDQATRIMWEHDVGVVPIVDDARHVVGMLTDRDACMASYTKGKLLSSIPIGDVMSKNIVSAGPDDDLSTAEKLMCKAQVRRLPVLDREGRLIGILSQNDLLREAGKHGPEMTNEEITGTLAAISQRRFDPVTTS